MLGDAALCRVADGLRESAREGRLISEGLHQNPLIREMLTNMIAVREETGSLPDLLGKVSTLYDREVNRKTTALTKLIAPALLATMAGLVGFIAISVFTPVLPSETPKNLAARD